jgi:hypothetical protein
MRTQLKTEIINNLIGVLSGFHPMPEEPTVFIRRLDTGVSHRFVIDFKEFGDAIIPLIIFYICVDSVSEFLIGLGISGNASSPFVVTATVEPYFKELNYFEYFGFGISKTEKIAMFTSELARRYNEYFEPILCRFKNLSDVESEINGNLEHKLLYPALNGFTQPILAFLNHNPRLESIINTCEESGKYKRIVNGANLFDEMKKKVLNK